MVTYGMTGAEVLKVLETKYAVAPLPEELRENMKAYVPSATAARTYNLFRFKAGVLAILGSNPLLHVIPHEALHIAQDVLEYIDTRFSEDTEEVYAHLVGYLAKEMMLGAPIPKR